MIKTLKTSHNNESSEIKEQTSDDSLALLEIAKGENMKDLIIEEFEKETGIMEDYDPDDNREPGYMSYAYYVKLTKWLKSKLATNNSESPK